MSIINYPYIFKINTVYWKVGTRQGLPGMETANKQWTNFPTNQVVRRFQEKNRKPLCAGSKNSGRTLIGYSNSAKSYLKLVGVVIGRVF